MFFVFYFFFSFNFLLNLSSWLLLSSWSCCRFVSLSHKTREKDRCSDKCEFHKTSIWFCI
ncbi:hypothetical protein DOM22_16975 [Bdellovibrio sp. ZAP7]|nr:hypothetical protein DOM22_16975 [Bdellovibrio sp. ZAP7]